MTPGRGFDLQRFLAVQDPVYATALEELRAGRKQSHWIWFVFPQLRGLGRSATSEVYGLDGLAEARAYLAHPVLGPRLRESVEAMLAHRALPASTILGDTDALKFSSCLTLFEMADPADPLFVAALDAFFAGQRDVRTIDLLEALGEA